MCFAAPSTGRRVGKKLPIILGVAPAVHVLLRLLDFLGFLTLLRLVILARATVFAFAVAAIIVPICTGVRRLCLRRLAFLRIAAMLAFSVFQLVVAACTNDGLLFIVLILVQRLVGLFVLVVRQIIHIL